MLLLDIGPADAPAVLLLAHGAGAGMESPFMTAFAALLGERGIATCRFEFAYMAARREGGKRRPPPKAETLLGEFAAAIEARRATLRRGQRLLIGGKSMGGRVASLIAASADSPLGVGQAAGALSRLSATRDREIAGLVVLGYPFHPPNRPNELRTGHLARIACPALFVQGERDPFGTRAEVEAMALPRSITLHWAGDGDHDLGPRGGSGFTRKGNLAAAADAVASFVRRV